LNLVVSALQIHKLEYPATAFLSSDTQLEYLATAFQIYKLEYLATAFLYSDTHLEYPATAFQIYKLEYLATAFQIHKLEYLLFINKKLLPCKNFKFMRLIGVFTGEMYHFQ